MKLSALLAQLHKYPESEVEIQCDPSGATSTACAIAEVTGVAGARMDGRDSVVVIVPQTPLFTRRTK